MSTDAKAGTRQRILEAARSALEEGGYHDLGLEDVARRAGFSRQAVYLNFGSRAGLFGELLTYVEETERLGELLAPVWEAPSGTEALNRLIDAHAKFEPRIARLAEAFEQARAADDAFRSLYEQRMQWRYDGMRAITARMRAEGVLAEGWTIDNATAFVWALTAPATFRLLVAGRGWSPRRWASETKRLLHRALLADDSDEQQGSRQRRASRTPRR